MMASAPTPAKQRSPAISGGAWCIQRLQGERGHREAAARATSRRTAIVAEEAMVAAYTRRRQRLAVNLVRPTRGPACRDPGSAGRRRTSARERDGRARRGGSALPRDEDAGERRPTPVFAIRVERNVKRRRVAQHERRRPGNGARRPGQGRRRAVALLGIRVRTFRSSSRTTGSPRGRGSGAREGRAPLPGAQRDRVIRLATGNHCPHGDDCPPSGAKAQQGLPPRPERRAPETPRRPFPRPRREERPGSSPGGTGVATPGD